MGILIAVTGKGGVGKTAVTALIVKCLVKRYGDRKNILVIDADPDANLPDALGVEVDVKNTIGYIANEFKKSIARGELPPSVDKGSILESRVLEAVVEIDKYDLLVMWRTEGEGCYCFVNEVLSKALDWLMDGYDFVVMDCEAGLEHFNRRVFKNVDHLMIVVDGSKQSFDTAKRIKSVVYEVGIKVANMWIIANKVPKNCTGIVEERCREISIPLLGVLPVDQQVFEYYIKGTPIYSLPDDNPCVRAIEEMLDKIGILAL